MAKRQLKYPLDQSPLYKLESRRKLAQILEVPLSELERLANAEEDQKYRVFVIPEKNDLFSKPRKERKVQDPKEALSVVHRRLFVLLSRIDVPDYLHSTTRGRSYISNAAQHKNQARAVKLDIKKFFPSITGTQIHAFFRWKLKCSPDVSALLTKLCTYGRALPTGSPISPILSYFAHQNLFDEIHSLAIKRGLVFTCYVDDLVLSGDQAGAPLVAEISEIITRHGLSMHPTKTKIFLRGHTKLITGVAVAGDRLLVPHERFMRIRRLKAAATGEKNAAQRLKLLEKFVGMLGEVSQIDNRFVGWMKKETSSLALLRASARPTQNGKTRPSAKFAKRRYQLKRLQLKTKQLQLLPETSSADK